jgi:cobalt-zinc-cadmium efflux system protein
VGITLNTVFVVVEAVYGVIAGSMALVADAGHNLSDVLGLVIAWAATVLSARPPSARFTYGFKSSSILAALANAALLLAALGAISVETIRRLFEPQPIATGSVMVVAAIGIVINTATAVMFMGGRDRHQRARRVPAHGGRCGGLGRGGPGRLRHRPDRRMVDRPGGEPCHRRADRMEHLGSCPRRPAHEPPRCPRRHQRSARRAFLVGRKGVSAVHDLHIWPMSTTETALTAHLVMPGGHPGDVFAHLWPKICPTISTSATPRSRSRPTNTATNAR